MIRATQTQVTQFVFDKLALAQPSSGSVPDLVQKLVALPALNQADIVLGIRARLTAFQPHHLGASLQLPPTLMQRPLMRNWPFLIPTTDFAMFQGATERQRRQYFNSQFLHWQVPRERIEQLAERILAMFAEQSLTEEQVVAQLEADHICELTHTSRGGRVSSSSNVSLALNLLEAEGKLLAKPALVADDWARESGEYIRAEVACPDLAQPETVPEAEAQAWLARAYVTAYGPVTEADVSFWTGFGKSETGRAMSALARETTLTMVEAIPGAMVMLKSQADQLKATVPAEQPVVRLLPANDPYVIAYKASRARLLAERQWQRQVFNNQDHAAPTIMVDGQIVGMWTWRRNEAQNQIQGQMLSGVDFGVQHLVQTELASLANFVGAEAVIS